MKFILVSLLFLFLIIIPGSSSLHAQAGSNSGKPIPMTRLRSCLVPCSFAYYSGLDEPLRLIITDPDAWREIWKRIHSNHSELPPLPEVDFSRDKILVVALGARPTGGYGIIIDGAYERDDRIEVIVQSQSPGKSCMTTQAVIQPVDIVLLPKMDRPIVFQEKEEVLECEHNANSTATQLTRDI
jgi:hypothetical protein